MSSKIKYFALLLEEFDKLCTIAIAKAHTSEAFHKLSAIVHPISNVTVSEDERIAELETANRLLKAF